MNSFLRNIERIRDAEREAKLAETKGAELLKSHGGGPGRRGGEDAQAKRSRMAKMRESISDQVRAQIYEACRVGDMDTARLWIAKLQPSQRADLRYRVVRRGFQWPA